MLGDDIFPWGKKKRKEDVPHGNWLTQYILNKHLHVDG